MVQNAFTTVRPRGPDRNIPAKPPKRQKPGAALTIKKKALDANGRKTVDLAPRTAGQIVIESRERAQAGVDRRVGISKGGTK